MHFESEFELDTYLPPTVRRTLNEYRESVHAEMTYLRDQGGRRYRIVNGERIRRERTGSIYCFDMESELFLSDDAPVSVEVENRSVRGQVVACEDFQITLSLAEDIGETVASAFVRADPWKLLQALNDRLKTMDSTKHRIAVRLMQEGPLLATKRPVSNVETGQDAAKAHVREHEITVIWGPPGTGKTYTMAEIAISHVLAGKSVLAVSHSNVSVDGIVLKVAELLRQRGNSKLIDYAQIMRFGHVRDEALDAEEDLVAHHYALSCNPWLKDDLSALNKKLAELRKQGVRNSSGTVEIQRRIGRIRKALAEDEKRAVSRARFVATTASKMYANKLFEGRKYDLVLFDEVSMAYVPQIMCAAMHADKKLVLVGDFRQLAPITSSSIASKLLSKDIFSFLGITDNMQKAHYHPWLVMLDEQRRMHPDISAFSSAQFYERLLKDHESVVHARDNIAASEPCAGKPMTLVDLRGAPCASARNVDNSRFNVFGAIVSFGLALAAVRDDAGSVGIIAPYIAQVRLIRAMIMDYQKRKQKGLLNLSEVACSTVHQFQGSERDVIVLDTVESYPSSKPGILTYKNENGSVDRLVNVAVTRARGKLVTVANESFWDERTLGRKNAFGALCKHHLDHNQALTAHNGGLGKLLSELDFGPNIKYFDEREAEEALLRDIDETSQRIVISLPDGDLTEPFASLLYLALRRARQRKVEVLVKCFNYDALSSDMKTYAWQSDDAIFPLTILDGTICWYGMPPSRMMPPMKTGVRQPTTIMTPIRIEGLNTISMIWSLARMDQRKSDKTAQTLMEKYGTQGPDDDGKGAYGLAGYIKEHEKCPKCKGPMRMVRSRKGANYLRCPRCENREYLTKQTVNHYMSVKLVRCPTCGSTMTACLGMYGIFVMCDNDRRHTFNPDQI